MINPEKSYEQILFHALVNEKKHLKILSAKREKFMYNEKQLKDEAAAEVLLMTQPSLSDEDDDVEKEIINGENGKKKRKKGSTKSTKPCRDRNREHARNTRLRKKLFLQKLQDLCESLTSQRNKEIEDRITLGKQIYQTQILRMEAVRNFLFLRASNVQDYSQLSLLLDDSFTMTLPITPYMAFNKTEVVNCQRVLVGINSYLADVASLAMMVETVGFGTPAWIQALLSDQGCRIWYDIGDKGDIIPAADIVMCRFFMRSEGHDRVGAPTSLAKHGMLRCRFNNKNKIVSAEMTFDVMSFMQQYQRAALLNTESSIVPNSYEMAIQPSVEARLIANFLPPYRVTFVNRPWCKLRGYPELSEHLFVNQTLEEAMTIQQIGLNSHHTDLITTILSCIPQVCRGIPTRAHWIYSSPGTGLPVLAYIKMIPIFHEASGTTQFLMTLAEISLPSHILADPLRMLSHPVVTPKISTPQQHPEDSLSDIFFDFAPLEIPQLNSTFVKKNHLDFFH